MRNGNSQHCKASRLICAVNGAFAVQHNSQSSGAHCQHATTAHHSTSQQASRVDFVHVCCAATVLLSSSLFLSPPLIMSKAAAMKAAKQAAVAPAVAPGEKAPSVISDTRSLDELLDWIETAESNKTVPDELYEPVINIPDHLKLDPKVHELMALITFLQQTCMEQTGVIIRLRQAWLITNSMVRQQCAPACCLLLARL